MTVGELLDALGQRAGDDAVKQRLHQVITLALSAELAHQPNWREVPVTPDTAGNVYHDLALELVNYAISEDDSPNGALQRAANAVAADVRAVLLGEFPTVELMVLQLTLPSELLAQVRLHATQARSRS